MASHRKLVGYPDNAAATAAASAAQLNSQRQSPYRVWQCARCYRWHAAPWIGHAHYAEVDAMLQGTSA